MKTVRIKVFFSAEAISDIYHVTRVPSIGESVYNVDDNNTHEVQEVTHIMNADPETQIVATIRVK